MTLTHNRRWFEYNNAPLYFAGLDIQELFSTKSYSLADIDYKLDRMAEHRINKLRVWAETWFKGVNGYYPWTVDASGRKNLDVWDETYWSRMKTCIQKCKDRDIIVEVTIFSSYPWDNASNGWWQNTTWMNAWNKDFNVNGAFSTNSSGDIFPEFFTLDYPERSNSGKTLFDYQKALVDKTVDELNGFGNVYFEVCNEFLNGSFSQQDINTTVPWAQYWADYIHNNKGAIVSCHVGAVGTQFLEQYFRNQSYVDVLTHHYYSTGDGNIDTISDLLHSLQRTGQILQCNESWEILEQMPDVSTREMWAALTSGGYYAFYQSGRTTDAIGNSTWSSKAEQVKVLRNIADIVNLSQMSPVDASGNEYDTIIQQAPSNYWQVIANIGLEYIIYFSINPSSSSVRISLPTGTYNYRYYDTRSWNSSGIANGTISSNGGTASIPAPSSGNWNGATGMALVIRNTSISCPELRNTLTIQLQPPS